MVCAVVCAVLVMCHAMRCDFGVLCWVHSYPHGESYTDVIDRLEIVIFELERVNRPILVVGHQVIAHTQHCFYSDCRVHSHLLCAALCSLWCRLCCVVCTAISSIYRSLPSRIWTCRSTPSSNSHPKPMAVAKNASFW